MSPENRGNLSEDNNNDLTVNDRAGYRANDFATDMMKNSLSDLKKFLPHNLLDPKTQAKTLLSPEQLTAIIENVEDIIRVEKASLLCVIFLNCISISHFCRK